MNKHTPGPWFTTSEMQGIGGVKVYGVETQERYPIANCGTGNMGENNAHLIAAAPAMYAALKAIQAWSFGQPWPCREMKQFTDIDAALAQAEGAQHE